MSPTSSHHSLAPESDLPGLRRGTLWLLIQLVPLTLLLLHVQFWARSPQSPERFAPTAVLLVQLLTSAVTFPWLFASRGLLPFMIGTAVFFALVANIAAEQPLQLWLHRSAVAIVWLSALSLLARCRFGKSACAVCTAAFAILSALVAILSTR